MHIFEAHYLDEDNQSIGHNQSTGPTTISQNQSREGAARAAADMIGSEMREDRLTDAEHRAIVDKLVTTGVVCLFENPHDADTEMPGIDAVRIRAIAAVMRATISIEQVEIAA